LRAPKIAGGDEIVDARLHEEHEAKQQLSNLEGMDIDSKDFLDELMKFRAAVVAHAEHEENEEFNKLQPQARLRRFGADGQRQCWPPRRSHPPVRTPGVESAKANFAVGPFASMLDRARDLIGAALR